MKEDFYLLDSRAGISYINGTFEDESDPGKYILLVGTLEECCNAANNNSYGDFCVVSDIKFDIKWELYDDNDKWNYKKRVKHGFVSFLPDESSWSVVDKESEHEYQLDGADYEDGFLESIGRKEVEFTIHLYRKLTGISTKAIIL